MQTLNQLTKLAYKFRSYKVPESGYSYTDFYYNLLSDKKYDVKKVLQIGLGDKEESSLKMWDSFFPKAKIYGIGDYKKYVFKRGGIQTFLCDRGSSAELNKLISKIGGDIDIVVDEGNRSPNEVLATFNSLMPLLKNETMYFIENTDRHQAAEIAQGLENYNLSVMRHHKMISRFDRLILVTNKTA